MPRSPRVLMVTSRFPPYMGGIETHVREVAPRLRERGIDVSVLTTDLSGELPVHELVDGVSVRRIPAYPRNRDYYAAPGLLAEIGHGKYDLLHVQGYHNLVAPISMAAAWRAGIPYVVSFHSGGHSSSFRRFIRGAQRLALRPGLRHARRLIAVSRYELDLFQRSLRLSPSRFALVRNGTNPRQVVSHPDPDPLVLSIGRLERYKGHHRLVQAWPLVLRRFPRARLLLLGEGPYRPELDSLIMRLSLAESVSISSIPPGDPAEMTRMLGRAHLVALLSDYEAHPVAIMEALAARRPVLVARTSGLTELVDQGLAKGIAVSAGNKQVAAAVVSQLERPIVADASQLPTWDDCAAQLDSIYAAAWH